MTDLTGRDRPMHGPRYGLSVDVEDYFQVWAFSDLVRRDAWDGYALRVERATNRLLDLFDEKGAKATFFTLGWVAERTPRLMREIVARGHELASHGYDHQKVFDQQPEEFRQDVVKAKSILEDLSGVGVTGYRAPGFSIDQRTPWAYEILAQTGHLYSSSAHPIAHDHYGDPNGPRRPHAPVEGAGFIEAPVATAEVFGRRVSAAGGGWFRAAPYAVSKRLIHKAAHDLTGPVIFYFHPWEIDPGQPRFDNAQLKSKFRHYLNLSKMEGKLSRLLDDFVWERIDQMLHIQGNKDAA